MKEKENGFLSATTIAQRSFCEKQLVLDKQYGQQETDIQRQRRERGDEEHLRHHLEAQRYGGNRRDNRCFIATELYGPSARETNLLREFRDTRLLTTCWGRIFTHAYYELSPSVVRFMKRFPTTKTVIKPIINWIVKRVGSNG